MARLVLDRMSIEEAGANPQRLAEAVLDQLDVMPVPIPVREIALALDIIEIREERLNNLEAALLTTSDRKCGSVLLNLNSSPQRRRFSLAHELLHFLNPWHEQTSAEGFRCSRADMRMMSATDDRHVRQEAEANEFAIELLTPRSRLKPFLRASACLVNVLRISDEFDISKEAAARRYVKLHDECLAVVFTKDGKVTYWDCGTTFPRLALRRNKPCSIQNVPPGSRSIADEVDSSEWLLQQPDVRLTAQTLGQANGHAITLLNVDLPAEDDDAVIDDAVDRLSRWNP